MKVPVPATCLVQVPDKDITFANDQVIRQCHAEKRAQEDAITVQELEEARGRGEYLPWTDAHAENIAHPHAAFDVEPAWEQGHEVRSERDHVGSQFDQGVSVDEDDVDDGDAGSATMTEIVVEHVMVQIPPISQSMRCQ